MDWPAHPFDALVALMARLRGPDGCPWDREQDLETLKGYLLEETYEVLEAIDSGDRRRLREELGDLLLQIAFQSQIGAEEGAFDAYDVCRAIHAKMVRRHPHVFGDGSAAGAGEARANWERIKAREGEPGGGRRPTLAGVPATLPALLRAFRIAEKAGSVGFDWPDRQSLERKIDEEWGELHEALEGGDRDEISREYGDLLFALASYGRVIGANPEEALRGTAERFSRRFRHVEVRLAERGRTPEESDLQEMDALWDEAKALERAARGE
ncbi:nucleoside triphosphate pyrophosphohydrolase [Myxococcota bacterium]|nr:nucleoside triphosphate pyrophosphohydrolase [Myxococcota bacterium]